MTLQEKEVQVVGLEGAADDWARGLNHTGTVKGIRLEEYIRTHAAHAGQNWNRMGRKGVLRSETGITLALVLSHIIFA